MAAVLAGEGRFAGDLASEFGIAFHRVWVYVWVKHKSNGVNYKWVWVQYVYVMKQNTDADAIKATQTNADVHGSTLIRPGDRVKTNSGWARVVEVKPDDGKLKTYGSSIGAGVSDTWAADVVGYEPRDD